MRKTDKELNTLMTPRLLSYYKTERRRFYGAGYWCSCGCGEFIWEVDENQARMERKYIEHRAYLDKIKAILDSREHVI